MNKFKYIAVIVLTIFVSFSIFIEYSSGQFTTLLILFGVLMLALVPKWSFLGLFGCIMFMNSPMQLPHAASPQLWMLACFVSVLGIPIAILQYKLTSKYIMRSKLVMLIFVLLIAYGASHVVSIVYHNIPLGVLLGKSTGRFYLESFLFILLPLVCLTLKFDNNIIKKVFPISLILSGSYALLDVTYYLAPGLFPYMMMFMELPTDFVNFAQQSSFRDYTRLPGVGLAAVGLGYYAILKLAHHTPELCSASEGRLFCLGYFY